MDRLIAELEAATEGSREFDVRIEITRRSFLAGLGAAAIAVEIARIKSQISFAKFAEAEEVPHFSTSLDAALTLVPEGSVWHVMTDYGDLNRAKIGPEGQPSASIYHDRDEGWGRPSFRQADAATPALALCIAALKVRSRKFHET